jgi:flagellar biosynthesis/type III secretory pathway protein FliH
MRGYKIAAMRIAKSIDIYALISDIEEALDKAYQDGYDEGYNEGLKDGGDK